MGRDGRAERVVMEGVEGDECVQSSLYEIHNELIENIAERERE